MNYSAILNINPVSHYDAVHIAAHNGVEPNAALIAHHHIA
jgi:hypothetical protein